MPIFDSEKATESYHGALKDHPIGYPRLAERIAQRPETAIYRRFDALNARNLLYLQSELCSLEKLLRYHETADNRSTDERRSEYATNFERMLGDEGNIDKVQLEYIMRIRKKLNQYNKALIQQELLHRIRSPDTFDLNDIRCFLYSDKMGRGRMSGQDRNIWGEFEDSKDRATDLIGIKPRKHVDWFSRKVAENAIHFFRCGVGRCTGTDNHSGQQVYYDETILNITLRLTSIIASLIPVASIIVLLSLDTAVQKLAAIAAFNVLITGCLLLFTEARRTDIFTITAAFAAVQVVFLGADFAGKAED